MKGFNIGALCVPAVVVVLIVLLMTGGCAKKADINHFYGLNQDFSGLKRYVWDTPSSIVALSRQDRLVDENVRVLANHQLSQKGFHESSEKPDFNILLKYEYEDYTPLSYRLSMLTLNIYRAESKELLWRGTASGSIHVDMASGELRKAVQDILAQFPPYSAPAPEDVTLANLGFQALQQNDYAEAEKYLLRALSKNPENPYALLNLGAVYQNTERADLARSTYEILIALNPEDVAFVSNQTGATGKKLVDIAKENLAKLK